MCEILQVCLIVILLSNHPLFRFLVFEIGIPK